MRVTCLPVRMTRSGMSVIVRVSMISVPVDMRVIVVMNVKMLL